MARQRHASSWSHRRVSVRHWSVGAFGDKVSLGCFSQRCCIHGCHSLFEGFVGAPCLPPLFLPCRSLESLLSVLGLHVPHGTLCIGLSYSGGVAAVARFFAVDTLPLLLFWRMLAAFATWSFVADTLPLLFFDECFVVAAAWVDALSPLLLRSPPRQMLCCCVQDGPLADTLPPRCLWRMLCRRSGCFDAIVVAAVLRLFLVDALPPRFHLLC